MPLGWMQGQGIHTELHKGWYRHSEVGGGVFTATDRMEITNLLR